MPWACNIKLKLNASIYITKKRMTGMLGFIVRTKETSKIPVNYCFIYTVDFDYPARQIFFLYLLIMSRDTDLVIHIKVVINCKLWKHTNVNRSLTTWLVNKKSVLVYNKINIMSCSIWSSMQWETELFKLLNNLPSI